jgi:biopolymer transport protein ExbD
MSDQPKRFFDLWFVEANSVIKEAPFHVVTDWIAQGRAVPDDRIKPSGTSEWYPLGTVVAFQPYFPKAAPEEPAEPIPPAEMEVDWPKDTGYEDEDVDMIPLIDISLVLLIFFMMTMTVSAISRIQVPSSVNALSIESDPTILRIDIDWREGKAFYGLAVGNAAPAPEDDNLSSDVELSRRLDAKLGSLTSEGRPKVRIAAHGDVPYYMVEEVMKGLDRRMQRQQIRDYAVEVNERARQ